MNARRADGSCPLCGGPISLESPQRTFGRSDTDALLQLELFSVSCGSCGRLVHLPYTCLWADETLGAAVRLTLSGEVPVQFKPSRDGMALRDTGDMLTFREKIMLWSTGCQEPPPNR